MDKLVAADAIRAAIRPYRALNEFADELEKLGSIEQASVEANRAADKARAELAEANKQLVSTKGKLKEARDLVEAEANMHAGIAKIAIEKAEQEAAAIVANAKSQAQTLVADANAKAAEATNAGAAKLASINADIAAAADTLKSTNAAIAQAQSDLADVQRRADEVKASLKAFVG